MLYYQFYTISPSCFFFSLFIFFLCDFWLFDFFFFFFFCSVHTFAHVNKILGYFIYLFFISFVMIIWVWQWLLNLITALFWGIKKHQWEEILKMFKRSAFVFVFVSTWQAWTVLKLNCCCTFVFQTRPQSVSSI